MGRVSTTRLKKIRESKAWETENGQEDRVDNFPSALRRGVSDQLDTHRHHSCSFCSTLSALRSYLIAQCGYDDNDVKNPSVLTQRIEMHALCTRRKELTVHEGYKTFTEQSASLQPSKFTILFLVLSHTLAPTPVPQKRYTFKASYMSYIIAFVLLSNFSTSSFLFSSPDGFRFGVQSIIAFRCDPPSFNSSQRILVDDACVIPRYIIAYVSALGK
ncbi:hypothetical protein C8R42DRAFT_718893 [Lentinula raphanica]|nr:hypothetical protein C8R42DRAFT_718893 [Lentinula raphanica]